VKTARITRLAALKRQVELQKWLSEASRLHEELKRLNERIEQVDMLKTLYNQQLRAPSLTSKELIGIRIIDNHLNDRRDIDHNRRELLEVERQHMAVMLAQKKTQVDTLQLEAKQLKRAEANERFERLQALVPLKRNS
jgi:outer membrane protein assembly factor BamD (BamD/ComL family)